MAGSYREGGAMDKLQPRSIRFEVWLWDRLCEVAATEERKPAAQARLIIKQALERRKDGDGYTGAERRGASPESGRAVTAPYG